MKQLFITSIMIVAAVSQLLATDPPAEVKASFDEMFPDVGEVEWDFIEEDTIHMAWFNLEEAAIDAFFLPDGLWIRTVTYLGDDALPEAVLEYFVGESFACRWWITQLLRKITLLLLNLTTSSRLNNNQNLKKVPSQIFGLFLGQEFSAVKKNLSGLLLGHTLD